MKRKFYSELDDSSWFALNVVATLQTDQPSEHAGILVPAGKLYKLCSSYLDMYDDINKGRATFVEETRILH